jgi:hypothetical protein
VRFTNVNSSSRRSRKNAYGLKNLDILTIAFKIYFNYVYLYLGRIKNIMLKLDLNELVVKEAFYRIVLMENLARRDGGSVAEIGYYDPMKK